MKKIDFKRLPIKEVVVFNKRFYSLLTSVFMFTFLVFMLSACQKDDDKDNSQSPIIPDTPKPSVLTCEVNGVPFEAEEVKILWVSSAGGVNKIGCEATDAHGNGLSFAVEASTVGTYELSGSDSGTSSTDFIYAPEGTIYFAGFGFQSTAVVTFTQIDNYDKTNMEISGEFNFTVSGSNLPDSPYIITEGVFEHVRW